ncbi:DUF6622 family protein [uncultured Sneathiella sp.]|uniref:DUF6622 family protein n=1 Tax=uncultured Sneathiella sp. TaxID=879315 RepID=UPI0030EE334F|tara:strand:- start:30954 stop:31478 length:525 start_codon:yes stop_codon:yes gene_type:complete
MSIMDIITHTPIWVWPLFALLVMSGITALRPREVRPVRMLLIPVFFFVWGLYAVFTNLPEWPTALAVFGVGLGVGFGVGWGLFRLYPAATYDRKTRRVWRPGTPLTLIFIIISFLAKYALSVVIATNKALSATVGFSALYGASSGLISGVFWGIMTLQLLQAFNYIEQGERSPG